MLSMSPFAYTHPVDWQSYPRIPFIVGGGILCGLLQGLTDPVLWWATVYVPSRWSPTTRLLAIPRVWLESVAQTPLIPRRRHWQPDLREVSRKVVQPYGGTSFRPRSLVATSRTLSVQDLVPSLLGTDAADNPVKKDCPGVDCSLR